MAYIVWTKTWSAADDGSILTGAQLGNLENDIATVVNGGITDVNVGAGAAIAESKIAFSTSVGHSHNGTDSKLVSSSNIIARSIITGVEMSWLSAITMKVFSGALDINGTIYTRTTDSTTLDITNVAHYITGVSEQGTNKWLYVYAYNDATTTWDVKLSATAPQYSGYSAGTSGPLIYRYVNSVYYRCVGAIRLNATGAGEIVKFYQNNNIIMYDVPINITTTLSKNAWSAAISCSTGIPAISIVGIFNYNMTLAADERMYASIRRNGSTYIDPAGGSNCDMATGGSASATHCGVGSLIKMTDSSQQIQHYDGSTGAGSPTISIDLQGYYLNIR